LTSPQDELVDQWQFLQVCVGAKQCFGNVADQKDTESVKVTCRVLFWMKWKKKAR